MKTLLNIPKVGIQLRGRTFFQPGTHLEHFLRGAKLSTKNLRGLKKCTENIRGLKILDVAEFKGCEIFSEYSLKAFVVLKNGDSSA